MARTSRGAIGGQRIAIGILARDCPLPGAGVDGKASCRGFRHRVGTGGAHYEEPLRPLERLREARVLRREDDVARLQQRGGAIASLDELIKDSPEASIIPRAHLALGNLYYDIEKYPESIQHYRVIVDDQKADPSLLQFAISNLIETYEVAGVNDAALALTRRYLEKYPNADDSFDKKIKIGILYDRLGYYDQAVLHLQGLLEQAGSDMEGEIRYYIAEANFNKGDYQQAILDFLKVPYLVTKKGKVDWTANSLYMSGQSYEKMGRYDQALTMYQQIVERSGIDETFKAAARKEMDRVKLVLKKNPQ